MVFSCFRKPGGADVARCQYQRSSSPGGSTSEHHWHTEVSSPRGSRHQSEPPPREPKRIVAFFSAIAAASSSKTKFKEAFRRRQQGSRRFISMRLPSGTMLPAHVPRSLGRGDSYVQKKTEECEDLLHAASPQSQNSEFQSIYSINHDASMNPGDVKTCGTTTSVPPPGLLYHPGYTCSHTPSDRSFLSPQPSLRPTPSATLHVTANQASNAPTSPSQSSAAHNTCFKSKYPVQCPTAVHLQLQSHLVSSPSKQPSTELRHARASSPQRCQRSLSHCSISIPLDAGSQPFLSAPLGDTLHCASSNSVDPTASQEAYHQPRPAVSASMSGTALPSGRDQWVLAGRSTRDSIATCASGAATLEAHSSVVSNAGMNSCAVTSSFETNVLAHKRSSAGSAAPVVPLHAWRSSENSGTPFHELNPAQGSGTSKSCSQGNVVFGPICEVDTKPSDSASERSQQSTQHAAVASKAGSCISESHSPSAAQARQQLRGPSTIHPKPQAVHVSAPQSPHFATPAGHSQTVSSEDVQVHGDFSTPQAPISPERLSILHESLLPAHATTCSVQEQHAEVQLPGGLGEPCVDHSSLPQRRNLPSPAELLRILPSTSKCALSQPRKASEGAAKNTVFQQTPDPTKITVLGGLTPPQSLNLELSTPESRPMLTPDQRHTFSSYSTHAGLMGCVDNPVFSAEIAGKVVPAELVVSAAHKNTAVLQQRVGQHVSVEHQAGLGAVSGTEYIVDSSARIVMGAKRVAATRHAQGHENFRQNQQTRNEEIKQVAAKKVKREKKARQVATDEAAEMLFSTGLDVATSLNSEENISCIENMHDAGNKNVSSPPMPHTLSTRGTSAKPRAFPPLHRFPEFSLQPSASRQTASESVVSDCKQRVDICASEGSVSSSSGDCSAASEAEGSKVQEAPQSATDVSISVDLERCSRVATAGSDSCKVPQVHFANLVTAPVSSAKAAARQRRRERTNSTTSSKENSQAVSRGMQCNSTDSFATVGSRILIQDVSSGLNVLTPSFSVSGSGAINMSQHTRVVCGCPNRRPESVNRPFCLSSLDSHRYMPPDIPSSGNAAPTCEFGSTGADSTPSVPMYPSSFRSNCFLSGDAPRDLSGEADEASNKIDSSNATKPFTGGSDPAASAFAVDLRRDCPGSGHTCLSTFETALNHSTVHSTDSGASEAESQYLDAMISTTKSGLELDFSWSDMSGRSPVFPRSQYSHLSFNQRQRSLKSDQSESPGKHSSREAAIGKGQSDPYQQLPSNRHVPGMGHSSFAMPHSKEAGEYAAKFQADQMAEATEFVDERSANDGRLLSEPRERNKAADSEAIVSLPSPSYASPSPLPACASLPLVCPENEPKAGDILGGRFLLRRVVGTSPAAIIYAANDLQEGSVPCCVRIPAPKTPLAASMIALGRMQWLRGQLSQADGATSLVRILSMPNLLGHGIVVATESLEASVRGRMNRISSGKAKPFSNSDLRSLARQLLNGLTFMHKSGIIHGDITPDSLFFKSEEGAQIRFVDLGCGCFPTSDPKPSAHVNGFCRTPKSARAASSLGSFWNAAGSQSHRCSYGREGAFVDLDIETAVGLCRAPEAFSTPPIVSEKMDVWSVGCILYHMETGEPLGHEPNPDTSCTHGLDPSSPHNFSDSNSFWEETQNVVPHGRTWRSMAAFAPLQTNISGDFSEELLYSTLPENASRARRSSSPFRRTIGTPDSSGAAAALHQTRLGTAAQDKRLSAGSAMQHTADRALAGATNPAPAASTVELRAAAAKACAEMWDVDALVIVEDGVSNSSAPIPPPVNSNYAAVVKGMNGVVRSDGETHMASAVSADNRVECQRCAAAEAERDSGSPAITRDSPQQHGRNGDPAGHTAAQPPLHLHVSPASYSKDESSFAGNDCERDRPKTMPSSSAYPLIQPQRIRACIAQDFRSTGNLRPPPDFYRSAPVSLETTHESDARAPSSGRLSLLNVWRSTRWGADSKTSRADLPSPARSSRSPAPSSPTEGAKEDDWQRRSRGHDRGRSGSPWGIRSLSGAGAHAKKLSKWHSSSVPPTTLSFQSDKHAAPTAAGDSFLNTLEVLEKTVDLPLTISARESYNSLPNTQTLTRRGSVQSQSGWVTGAAMSSGLSCGLSGGLSQRGALSRPGSAPAGISCRPWLAQRLSKIQDREFAQFLSGLLEIAFMSRPSANQALQHPWLTYGGVR